MPSKALTSRFVETVKVETRMEFWDTTSRGLVLRVSPAGVKSWSVVYTSQADGAKKRLTLGQFPAISLERARKKALEAVASVADGADPAGSKRARRDAITVADLAGLYIAKYAKVRKKSWAEDERLLRVDVLPTIGKHKAASVTRRDILDLIDAKADAGKMTTSRHVLAVVRRMFGWAVDEDYLETSPVAGVKPRAKAVSRDRVLSVEEVQKVWAAIDTAALRPVTRDVLRLLFLTGQRSGEVCGMNRGEVDLDAGTWTIPAERVKNGRSHVVPLSAPATELLGSRLAAADEDRSAPLFSHTGGPIESNAIAHAARLKLQVVDAPWTPHDIRRTVATMMADLGIAPHEIEATLNHISGFRAGVAGIYNRNQYEKEKRRALDLWATRLEAIIRGEGRAKAKVLPMRRGRESA